MLGSRPTKIHCGSECAQAKWIKPVNQVCFEDEDAAKAAGYQPCRACLG